MERIVGAAVLVALGVWLIPLVLDGQQDADPADEAASATLLPAAEEGEPPVRTETVELVPRGAPAARDASGDTARDPSGGAAAEASAGSGTRTAAAADADAATAPAAAGADSAAAAGQAAAAADDSAAAGEIAAAAEQPAADGPAAADSAGADTGTTAAAAAAPAAGWTVQIGAFGELANAERQAERVGDFGYTASVSPIESGGRTLYRVRVGGFDTETQAEAARSSLSAHGFVGKTYPPE